MTKYNKILTNNHPFFKFCHGKKGKNANCVPKHEQQYSELKEIRQNYCFGFRYRRTEHKRPSNYMVSMVKVHIYIE